MQPLKFLRGPWENVRESLITDLQTIEAAINTAGLQAAINLGTIAAGKLLGRRSSSSGPAEEITLGTGLTMSGTTLSVNPATIPPGSLGALQGRPGRDGRDSNPTRWPWGGSGSGSSSSPAVDHQWSVLTNGDAASPELIFADGDVIMLEV